MDAVILTPTWLIVLFLIPIALSIGSLLNVVIYRLPIMLMENWQFECRQFLRLDPSQSENFSNPSVNLFWPRSFCIHCRQPVAALDNIPLLSYLILKGRCRQCRTKISIQYPLIELLTCVLSLAVFWHFGFSLTCLFALLFLWLILPLAIIDIQHQLLPDCLTLSLLWLGLIANTQNLFTSLPDAVLSAAGAYVFLWLCIKLFYLITGKIGMGQGDFKLFAALGAWFGWTQLLIILLSASLGGAIIGSIYLKIQKKDRSTPIPFGPFLCAAGLISLFFGTNIWQSYKAWM